MLVVGLAEGTLCGSMLPESAHDNYVSLDAAGFGGMIEGTMWVDFAEVEACSRALNCSMLESRFDRGR